MTASEKQLKDFIESSTETIFDMEIEPNGIEPTVTNEPVNIVKVFTCSSSDCGYTFGGIRESHFERMSKVVFGELHG